MATPQLSPGLIVREVDLTAGRVDNTLGNVGAIAGPFPIGPVDEPTDIVTEQQLINVFGKPISTDSQYEYWMSASNFLSYGGVLRVVRTDGTTLNNANSDRAGASTTVKIKNFDDYSLTGDSSDTVTWGFAAKNPGRWANNLKVCVIDDLADQTITGITTTSIQVGYGVTQSVAGTVNPGIGVTSALTGYLKGIVTGVGENSIDVKVTSHVSSANTETSVAYQASGIWRFSNTGSVAIHTSGVSTAFGTTSYTGATDWYDQQTLGLTNSTVFWKSLAPKPVSSNYSLSRNGKNDALHVVVVDDSGSVTGIEGNLLEKHLFLSKATDAISADQSPTKVFWKDYLALNSAYVYAGDNPSDGSGGFVAVSGFSSGFTGITTGSGTWNRPAQGITFNVIGNETYNLTGGEDYSASGGMNATLGDIVNSYKLFLNEEDIPINYLIMGPGHSTKEQSQAKANYLISIAEERKDCIATISPHKDDVVNVSNSDTQTDNVISFFSPLTSSSYAVFDSGYKYTYDRFNNKFVYLPCNADVAGLMARTDNTAFPWSSPAGVQRGALNNAIKLAYNPTKAQRDRLYPQRVNAIINQPGAGIVLFGDKTALGYASAFDRINVRKLFLTIQRTIKEAANAQLFEFNDALTRATFVNLVEPYLRTVQSQRGITDFVVVCDDTNNTPDIIDNNEFRAEIYVKPNRVINYITLTFVATRTGISFGEVAGRV